MRCGRFGRTRDSSTSARRGTTSTPASSLAGRTLVAGARVDVDPSATLEACVLWDDVRIGGDVRLRRVVVGDGVRLPAGYQADNVVLVRGANGLEVTRLD